MKMKKKLWSKPEVKMLRISKDSFSGSGYGVEEAIKSPYPPAKT